jgi:hypothetical protein
MLIFCDGFDHYDTSYIAKKWDSYDLYLASHGIKSNAGRFSSAGYSMSKPTHYLWKAFPTGPISSFTLGVAINPTNGVGMDYYLEVFRVTAWGSKLCGLGVTQDHQLFVHGFSAGGSELVHGYATEPIRSGTFQYLELQVIGISPTAGQMIARVNGVEVINVSNVATDGATGYTEAHAFWLGGAGVGYGGALSIAYAGEIWFDDFYATDTTDDSGAGNTGFLGDVRIEELTPNADGYYKEWTPLTGSTHCDMVNEIPPDDDTTYVSTLGIGARDTYTYPSITPTFGNVKAVVVNIDAQKVDSGSSLICALGRLGTTDGLGDTQSIGSNYAIWQSVMERDPTGATWTIANVKLSEYGMKLVG